MRFFLSLSALLFLSEGTLLAQGLFVTDKPVDSIGRHPILPRPPRPIDRYMPVEIRSTDVRTKINGQIATTTISQTLYNPASRNVQGCFLFPIPVDAKIDSFSMEIDGELTEGELLDAKKAQKIYEEIVRRTLDPALFEYSDRGLFKVRIFPLEARKTKEIRLQYTQLLPKDENLVAYTLPLKSREYQQIEKDKKGGEFSLKVELDCPKGRRLKTVYSPSHDIEIKYREKKTGATVELEKSSDGPVSDFQLVYSTAPVDRDADPVSAEFLTYFPGKSAQEGHFLLLISPDAWNEDKAAPQPKDVVFVLDSSASMRDGKLDKAKEGLDFCLDSLNENDRFQIVRFSTDSETLFKKLVPASQKNRRKAEKFIAGIRAIGGTAVEEALTVAVESLEKTPNEEKRPRQIVFITDGQPTLGATDEKVIVDGLKRQLRDCDETVRVFSFGIGTKINTHLLDLLARETRAHAQFALPGEDIEHKISRFYSRFAEPVFSDLEIEIDGVEWIRAKTPKVLPDVFRGDQLVVLGRLKKDQDKGKITVAGTYRGEEKVFTYPVKLTGKNSQHRFIPRLWAVRRVGWLLEQVRLNGESGELKDEITRLAREYAIVTPYTSWLILEDEARRDVPMTNRALRDLESTHEARRSVSGKADAFARMKSGDDALAAAASESDLKDARNVAAQSKAITRSYYTAKPGSIVKEELTRSQSINGKTFYCNSGQWVDSLAQALPADVPVKQIQFGSDDYFTFLKNNPQATQWFSAGQNMRLALNEKEIIEIHN